MVTSNPVVAKALNAVARNAPWSGNLYKCPKCRSMREFSRRRMQKMSLQNARIGTRQVPDGANHAGGSAAREEPDHGIANDTLDGAC